tara:strand:- start:284 stop:427 length:144 start_codon:yes stop_codon:yes gene_type:complete
MLKIIIMYFSLLYNFSAACCAWFRHEKEKEEEKENFLFSSTTPSTQP